MMKFDRFRLANSLVSIWRTYNPQVVISGIVHIGRGALAIVVSMTAITRVLETASTPAAEISYEPHIFVYGLIVLLFLTALLTAYMLIGPLRANRMPSPWFLTFGAVLDHLWVVLGWIITDYAILPFPVLLVIVIGVHGLLLGPLRTGILAIIAALFFGFAYAFAYSTSAAAPAYLTNESYLALFLGVAVLSVIVGNRIRAANWTVQQLHEAIVRLRKSHDHFFDQLPVGLALFAPGLEIVRANARLLSQGPERRDNVVKWLEAEIPEAVRGIERILDGDISEQSGESQSSAGRHYSWQLARVADPDLSTFPTTALSAPITAGESNRPIEMEERTLALLVLRDITDRRQSEEARRRADHFEQVAELSAGLAHELRNPLAALRSAAEQLTEVSWSDPVDARLARIVIREADRLDRLVGDFLNFARVGQGQVAQHSLHRLVDDAVQVAAPVAAERGVKLALSAPEANILTDADLVHRVLSNLVLNAVAFAPSGSTVDVEASIDGRRAVFRVRDRGPGVPATDRSRIFRPFVTSRPDGIGLGLAIAARAAAMLGGSLSVADPEDGEPGAVFVFLVPFDSNRAAP